MNMHRGDRARNPEPARDRPDLELALIEKNGRERIRIAVVSYRGQLGVDLRILYLEGDDWKFGKGLRLRPTHLAAVQTALEAARVELERLATGVDDAT